jgi:two-component system, response regulator / RNA-binding antiterminator
VVAGLSSERIRPILDVAMARFQYEQSLRKQLADTRSELDQRTAELQERKVIDRAKGLLMQRQGLTEQQAYDKLRKTAMDKNLRVAVVAQRMLDVADLLG